MSNDKIIPGKFRNGKIIDVKAEEIRNVINNALVNIKNLQEIAIIGLDKQGNVFLSSSKMQPIILIGLLDIGKTISKGTLRGIQK